MQNVLVSQATYASNTQLRGALLALARVWWAATMLVTLGTYAAMLPSRFISLRSLVAVGRDAVTRLGITAEFYAWYHISFEVAFAVACAAIGLIIFWRRSDDWMAMFISLTLVMFGARIGGFPIDAPRVVLEEWRWLLDGLLAMGMAFSLIAFYLFPDGRFVPRWTVILAVVWCLWAASWIIFPASPFNLLRWNESIDTIGLVYFAQAVWYGTGAVAQLRRYNYVSTPVQRQQTRWVVFGLVFVVVAYITLNLPYVVIPALRGPGMVRLIYGLIHKPLLMAALLSMPIAFMVAMLRYKLWDIGIVINRALVYSALTALLALIYGGIILALQQVLRPLTDDTPPLAIAASTLAIAALANPLRLRIQQFIDQRFYRGSYDITQTIADFGVIVRDEVDLTRLSERLEEYIGDILQPAHTLCWLCTPTGYNIHLFTEEQQARAGRSLQWARGEIPLTDPLINYVRGVGDVVELDALVMKSPALERFRRGGAALVVPLISHGDLIGWLPLGPRLSELGYSSRDQRLLSALASQAAPALRVAQLIVEQKAEAQERERLKQELQVARLIQQTLLPLEPPSLPGWHLAGFYQPAQAVGGDFYDFLLFEDGRLGLVVGDVTDKGIPAALVMASTRSLIRSAAAQLISPGRVLRHVNRLLHNDIPPAMFVTCWYALLDPQTGVLRYANAGHNLPYRRNNGTVSELRATGMPLGLMPSIEYEEKETTILPTETVLFYSDGLVEAHNPWREMFGGHRLHQLIAGHHGNGSSLIRYLMEELQTFTSNAEEQEDDVTLVTLERARAPS